MSEHILFKASAVLIQSEDKFLGVSRKDDHTNIGLPSGKLDEGESYEACAIREALEETGYTVELVDCVPFDCTFDGYQCITYLAKILPVEKATLAPTETGLVGFFDKQAFLDGSFGDYNYLMFKHFGV